MNLHETTIDGLRARIDYDNDSDSDDIHLAREGQVEIFMPGGLACWSRWVPDEDRRDQVLDEIAAYHRQLRAESLRDVR